MPTNTHTERKQRGQGAGKQRGRSLIQMNSQKAPHLCQPALKGTYVVEYKLQSAGGCFAKHLIQATLKSFTEKRRNLVEADHHLRWGKIWTLQENISVSPQLFVPLLDQVWKDQKKKQEPCFIYLFLMHSDNTHFKRAALEPQLWTEEKFVHSSPLLAHALVQATSPLLPQPPTPAIAPPWVSLLLPLPL